MDALIGKIELLSETLILMFVRVLRVAALFVLLAPLGVRAQDVSITPEQPTREDTLRITYHPAEDSATFAYRYPVRVLIIQRFSDFSFDYVLTKMERRGDRQVFRLVPSNRLAHVKCYFFPPDRAEGTGRGSTDYSATVQTAMYRPDGRPVWMAHVAAGEPGKELGAYPDNVVAYRDKWWRAWQTTRRNKGRGEATVDSMIRADLRKIKEHVEGEPTRSLYAWSVGHLLLGQDEKSRAALRRLATHSPTSPLVFDAIRSLHAVYALGKEEGGVQEITQLERSLARQHPRTLLAREWLRHYRPESGREMSIGTIEAVAKPWMAAEPENPFPYLGLARSYNAHHEQLERAERLVDRALDLVVTGHRSDQTPMVSGRRPFFDFFAPLFSDGEVAAVYQTKSEIALKRERYGVALASLEAARRFEPETLPSYFMHEAKIWWAAGDPAEAERAYADAWRQGSEAARDSLKALYDDRRGSAEGFASYIAKLGGAPRETAPRFEATTLSGRRIDLADLRGKVVVLNFWFVGCPPCIEEMPALNTLVEAFEDQKVEFLAFALDDERTLREFLRENTFKYQIIPESQQIARKYSVSSFPTHVVIDREGSIEFQRSGGSEHIHEKLRPVIERLLTR